MQYVNEQVEELFMDLEEREEKSLNSLVNEYQAMKAGRANQHVLDKITVDYYGAQSPLNQVANISIPESRMLLISPWDASMCKEIEKAIYAGNIGLTPSSDGKVIRLVFPELTEERRKDLAKQCKKTAEDSKVAIRNIRRDAMDSLKKMKNAKTLNEDEVAMYEKEVEKIVTKAIEKIDNMFKDKEKEVLTV
ncbi:MAG: ribosome recycling factor [Bacillota bacterium]